MKLFLKIMHALYSTDQPTKKNKTWHDASLEYTDGCLVMRGAEGDEVLIRQHISPSALKGKVEFNISRFTIQLEEPLQLESTEPSRRQVKQKSRFAIRYKSSNAPTVFKDGFAEYDGKSLVVFKDSNSRMFHKKICPEVSEGEIFESGPYWIEICEEQQSNIEKGIYSRKTLVSKSASHAAQPSHEQPPSIELDHNEQLKTETILKCIFTEDKQKKQQKRWIDAVMKLDEQGLAVIESEEGETILKRHFTNIKVLREGFEFDGGKYRFQITESSLTEAPSSVSNNNKIQPINRKRLLTVSELRSRKNDLISRQDEDDEEVEHQILNNYRPSDSLNSGFKKVKTDSMFDIFDD